MPSLHAEDVMTCFGNGAESPYPLLNAKEVLLGQTVTVRFFTDAAFNTGMSPASPVEKDPLVRKFSENAVYETSGSAKATTAITWEGPAWCMQEVRSGQKKCFGVIVARPTMPDTKFFDVEMLEDNFCRVRILGKLEGARVPEGGLPVPTNGRRRGR
jgi:hypothetical protein